MSFSKQNGAFWIISALNRSGRYRTLNDAVCRAALHCSSKYGAQATTQTWMCAQKPVSFKMTLGVQGFKSKTFEKLWNPNSNRRWMICVGKAGPIVRIFVRCGTTTKIDHISIIMSSCGNIMRYDMTYLGVHMPVRTCLRYPQLNWRFLLHPGTAQTTHI